VALLPRPGHEREVWRSGGVTTLERSRATCVPVAYAAVVGKTTCVGGGRTKSLDATLPVASSEVYG
ncbi:MAG: hypothetical protein KAQ74_06690, partial [Dehalococcoidia bacterium]|nr:hypothetical protein [Dehalococcoidia bacterium]